ncbi:type II CAAX endopeptidase family protein [Microtetraspora niveoalba]|uniref:type II CAAX endopeptidase family protein n=1 Tax=Microtetraspora niveoalba TaxID=46175 RepID=UPI000A4982F0|nr:type II CAAX endopeptidase family protein [Microtetraspora niveoalba]
MTDPQWNPPAQGNPPEHGNPSAQGNPPEHGNPSAQGNPPEHGNPSAQGNPPEHGNPPAGWHPPPYGGPGGPPPGPPYQWAPPPVRGPWSVTPPPGTRYDRLARTALHRWWRPIVGTLAIVVGYLVVSLVLGLVAALVSLLAGVPMMLSGTQIFADPLLTLGFSLVLIALAIPLVIGAAWAVQRRRPGTLSSVTGRLRWSWLLWCLPVALVAVVLGEVAQQLTFLATGVSSEFAWVGWDRFLAPLIVIVVLVPFQAAAEEYVFRGWIIQAFGAYLRNPVPGIVIGAAAFTSLHGYTDWGIAYVFGFGLLAGWLAIRTGGLEAPIALHAVNNVFAFGMTAAAGGLRNALEQGSVPWQTIVGTVVQFAVFTVVVLIIAQRRAIQTLSR